MHTNRRTLFKRLVTTTAAVAALAWLPPAYAQAYSPKIATDLAKVATGTTSDATWVKVMDGQTYVKVLIVADSADTKLNALRKAIVSAGGSVHYVYVSVRGLSGLVPVSALAALSARSDVVSISPNRVTARSGSLVQDTSGASAVPVLAGGAAVDGSGVGIAVLDSGIDFDHRNLKDAAGVSRVRQVFDVVALSQVTAGAGWLRGLDLADAAAMVVRSGSSSAVSMAAKAALPKAELPDPYGHGTHVASIAAGAGRYQTLNSSGVAPGAALFDVRVLDAAGVGNMADVLVGLDWVIQHAKAHGIRVINLSLAANSTDSFLLDPLARAARSAVASGLVVVAAAGNAGRNEAGAEVYGAIGSPGHEPSVITVGASNPKATVARADDLITTFSSRGPTRGALPAPAGSTRWVDNVLKPDLVAPGNRLVGAVANRKDQPAPNGNLLATLFPVLTQNAAAAGADQGVNQELMQLSGTSVAAPAVAGAAALMLQANPGLTPPLVKAILQYTAQPLPNANLLQQGTGQLNVEGAVRLARSLRSDVGPALAAGTLKAGDALLASGATLPQPWSTLNGERVNWSRLAYAGGGHLVSGDALFNTFQPIYDPGLTWVRQVALRNTVKYAPASVGVPANTLPQTISESNAGAQFLLTPRVVLADALANSNSAKKRTGLFASTATLSAGVAAGGGRMLGSGFILSEGFILAEGMTLGQQRLTGSGFILGEGFILSEGFILGEGFILSESMTNPASTAYRSVTGDN